MAKSPKKIFFLLFYWLKTVGKSSAVRVFTSIPLRGRKIAYISGLHTQNYGSYIRMQPSQPCKNRYERKIEYTRNIFPNNYIILKQNVPIFVLGHRYIFYVYLKITYMGRIYNVIVYFKCYIRILDFFLLTNIKHPVLDPSATDTQILLDPNPQQRCVGYFHKVDIARDTT